MYPFFYNEKWKDQQTKLTRINYIERSNGLSSIDRYEEYELQDLEGNLVIQIKSALARLSKYTNNQVVSLYFYLSKNSLGLTEGTYLCSKTKLTKVTSAKWIRKYSSKNSSCFIIASRLNKLIILGRPGLAIALKQTGVLESSLKADLNVDNAQIEKKLVSTNLNALSFEAGLNVNEIVILGIVGLED